VALYIFYSFTFVTDSDSSMAITITEICEILRNPI